MEDDHPNGGIGSSEPDKHQAPEDGRATNIGDPEISGAETTERDDLRTRGGSGQSGPGTP